MPAQEAEQPDRAGLEAVDGWLELRRLELAGRKRRRDSGWSRGRLIIDGRMEGDYNANATRE